MIWWYVFLFRRDNASARIIVKVGDDVKARFSRAVAGVRLKKTTEKTKKVNANAISQFVAQ